MQAVDFTDLQRVGHSKDRGFEMNVVCQNLLVDFSVIEIFIRVTFDLLDCFIKIKWFAIVYMSHVVVQR